MVVAEIAYDKEDAHFDLETIVLVVQASSIAQLFQLRSFALAIAVPRNWRESSNCLDVPAWRPFLPIIRAWRDFCWFGRVANALRCGTLSGAASLHVVGCGHRVATA